MEDLYKPTTYEINYRYADGSTRFVRKTHINYATALQQLEQRLFLVVEEINTQQAGLGIITSVRIGLAEKMDPEHKPYPSVDDWLFKRREAAANQPGFGDWK